MNETMLFVDDDDSLLQGLQRMLRSKRMEWDMTFVSGSRKAIKEIETRSFDVIVVDMRMPEIDGAELLQRVKKMCPKSVRIILSGQADLQTIMKAIGSTHQYISKPCDPEVLKATIDRASNLRKLMKNELLGEFISQLEYLPTQADLYDEILREINSENPSIEKIGKSIARDMGMTIKILQLVNSSFFGPAKNVANINEAVGILGLDILRKLLLTCQIFSRCNTDYAGGLRLDEINNYGSAIGALAENIALEEGIELSQTKICPTIGLLSNIGKLVLSLYAPEKYQEILKLEKDSELSMKKELELFGTTYAEAGGYLLGLWGLPDKIVTAATNQHQKAEAGEEKFTILSALQKAKQLIKANKLCFSK